SISRRKSQWSRRAACFCTRNRLPPRADLAFPLPEGSAVLAKSRFCQYSFSFSAWAIALGPLAFSGGFAGRGFRRLVFLHGFLERGHKVDNVRSAALRGFFHIFQDAGFLALGFLVDQFPQRIGVAIVKFSGVEFGRLLVDQRGGEIEQFLVRLGVGYAAEELAAFAHFILVAERLEQHSLAAWHDRHELFPAAYRQLPKRDLLRLAQRFAQHDIGFFRQLVRRRHVIGLLEIERIYLVRPDELNQL